MGGLYNVLYGYNSACFWILPMLNRKAEEYPRFRDCYIEELKDGEYCIVIYTRVGGNNRGCGYGEEELYKDPLFIETVDDEDDDTYAEYKFRVPEEFKEDFNKIIKSENKDIKTSFLSLSEAYRKQLEKFYPDMINKYFKQGGK